MLDHIRHLRAPLCLASYVVFAVHGARHEHKLVDLVSVITDEYQTCVRRIDAKMGDWASQESHYHLTRRDGGAPSHPGSAIEPPAAVLPLTDFDDSNLAAEAIRHDTVASFVNGGSSWTKIPKRGRLNAVVGTVRTENIVGPPEGLL